LNVARTSVIRTLPTFLLAAIGAIASAAMAAPPAWRSAFDGYQPFAEEKPVPWPQANETVRQVGGWRAYAREAAQPAQPASAAASASQPSQGGAAGPHGGHHKP
jgi:hypothetical protein